MELWSHDMLYKTRTLVERRTPRNRHTRTRHIACHTRAHDFILSITHLEATRGGGTVGCVRSFESQKNQTFVSVLCRVERECRTETLPLVLSHSRCPPNPITVGKRSPR
jgi:hypothetical protein